MIFSYYEINKLPIIVIDKLYTADESERIWQELCFLNNHPSKLKNPEDTGSAWVTEDDQKKFLKKNKAISLDMTYRDRGMSSILAENRKIFNRELTDQLIKYHDFFRYMQHINSDATLVSYYENSDFYLPHHDDATITAITWFYKNPKMFTGGDIIFENEVNIECISNRCVIFPSLFLHEVTKINMEPNLEKNCGRFTISQFLSFVI